MAIASARVSTMEERCIWVATSPESATSLYTWNAEGDAGCLATLISHR